MHPYMTDFTTMWIVAKLSISNQLNVLSNQLLLQNTIESITGIKLQTSFMYPPSFTMILSPLGYLSYFPSLLIWIFITFIGYFIVSYYINQNKASLLLMLAFPGTLINIGAGQNGFLTATFLGGGLLMLEKYPILSGIFFGLLTYKIHMVVLVPIALICGRCWKTIISMVITFITLVIITLIMFGSETWKYFIDGLMFGSKMLESGVSGQIIAYAKMTTVYAGLKSLNCGSLISTIIQSIIMVGCIILVTIVWLRKNCLQIKSIILMLAILLFTPYAYGYDLTILGLVILQIDKIYCPNELIIKRNILLSIAYVSPILTLSKINSWGLQIIPLVLLSLLVWCWYEHSCRLPVKEKVVQHRLP
jgi:hypothetical protein